MYVYIYIYIYILSTLCGPVVSSTGAHGFVHYKLTRAVLRTNAI